jgi:hypothetical protein
LLSGACGFIMQLHNAVIVARFEELTLRKDGQHETDKF